MPAFQAYECVYLVASFVVNFVDSVSLPYLFPTQLATKLTIKFKPQFHNPFFIS